MNIGVKEVNIDELYEIAEKAENVKKLLTMLSEDVVDQDELLESELYFDENPSCVKVFHTEISDSEVIRIYECSSYFIDLLENEKTVLSVELETYLAEIEFTNKIKVLYIDPKIKRVFIEE